MNKPFKLVITTLVCICLMVTIIPRTKIVYELSQRKTELEEQKLLLMEKNNLLTKEFEQAKSLENIERIAREQLGMVKSGEQIIMPVVSNNN